jgi:PAS domain S-box-containing protein
MKKPHTDHTLEEEAATQQAFLQVSGESESATFRKLQMSLALERLLVDISARLISSPLEAIDDEIEKALNQVRNFFQVDTCVLLEVQEDRSVVRVSHASYAEGIDEVPGDINLAVWYPWAYEKLVVQGIHLNIFGADYFPPEAEIDRQSYGAMGFRSNLDIPLFSENLVSHIIIIQNLREEGLWPDEIIPRVRLLGEICVNALIRKKSDLVLRASEARLSLAAESAEASLWVLFLDSGDIWTTDNSWDLYGIPRENNLTLQSFLELVHVDDRERLSCAVQEATREGRLLVEYRLLSADGAVHWVVSRGRVQTDGTGVPYCLTGTTVDITERKEMEHRLQAYVREIEVLKLRIENENLYLQEEVKELVGHGAIVSHSTAMRNVIALARQVAGTNSTVLILGESGTGKELIARAIHDFSNRSSRPLITVNCASLPPTLIEAELFGREKGAYTGAVSKMIGRFELADGSTIFLDEIGELPLELQAKLLRVIEDGIFQRLGAPAPIKVNIRIIAATNRNLLEEVKAGQFRSDLYYRLNVFPIHIAPLRERPEDIPPLVWSLVREFQETMGKTIDHITKNIMDDLTAYHWPGNVRELRNIIERAMIISEGSTLEVRLPELETGQKGSHGKALRDLEREQILEVLTDTKWRVGGKGGAAELLGLERTTLYGKMKKLGINRSA